jgi:hypothetical protein
MSQPECHRQVVAMLEDALDLVRRVGGVGVEICVLTADGISSYRYYNLDAPPDCADAAAALFAAMPCDGGTH